MLLSSRLIAMRSVLLRAVTGVVCVVVGAGCAGPGSGSSLRTCGEVPASTGVLRDVLDVHLAGPGEVASGSEFRGTVTVSLRSGVTPRQVSLSSGAPLQVVIARGTDVVGQYEGAVAGVGVIGAVSAGQPYRFRQPAIVLVRGCPRRPVDGAKPDDSRKLLPPGRYSVYAYIDDFSADSTSDDGVLRSQPFAITVTGAT